MKRQVAGRWLLMVGALAATVARAEEPTPVPYLDWDAETRQMTNAVCTTYEVVEGTDSLTFDPGTTYVVTGAVAVTSSITVNGTETSPTRLILCDGAKLTAKAGVAVGASRTTTNALVICGQALGSGTLEATGGNNAAGIGGGYMGAGGTVTINGGTVMATGGAGGAGIGGGAAGVGGTVTINGGTVTATGGSRGAGIGGGLGRAATGSVVFGAGKWLVEAGRSAQDANPVTVEAYKGDHSAAYVQIRSLLQMEPVLYLDWNAEKQALVEASTTEYVVYDADAGLAEGVTYVVTGEVAVARAITVNGTVASPTRLILCDGAKLTASMGVVVKADDQTTNALVICGQALGSGTLEATGGNNAAGIGGGYGGAGGTVTINGGTVTAKGGANAAGIGGGNGGAGGMVTINGGTVKANGGYRGAGIGGGAAGVGGMMTINGGTVTATGGINGEGIGGAGIGGGMDSTDPGSVSFGAGGWLVKAGRSAQGANPVTVEAYKGDHSAAYVQVRSLLQMEPVLYLDWDAEKQALVEASTTEYVVYDADAGLAEGVTYVVTGVVAVARSITVNGTVASPTRLILCDGAKLTASMGVVVKADDQMTNALVICGQTVGSGTLEATGGTSAAGIGGGYGGAGGTVTINGGTVTAKGGTIGSAGIGGGYGGAGGTVTINGGTVTAKGGTNAAGIGGGNGGAGGMVTINGGTVKANGGSRGAGIGGGSSGMDSADPGSVAFCAGGWQILAGSSDQSANSVTVEAYVANHSAAYAQIVPIVAQVISADGTETNDYTTLQEALENVGNAGATETNTVRLIRDVTENVELMSGYAAILDLNGRTLTGNDEAQSVITINEDAALTLTDTSAEQTGTVTMPANATGPGFGVGVYNAGTFTMTGGAVKNRIEGSGNFLISGGKFYKDGGWVVATTNGAAKVVITGLAEGETVAGIMLGEYIIPSGAFVGFGEGQTEGEFSLTLDEAGVVTIDGETIPVQVTIGEGVKAGAALVVGEEDVTVTLKAIPGLKYTLWRAGALAAPAGESAGGTEEGGGTVWGGPVVGVVATGTTVTLEDVDPPDGAAFYWVVVSVCRTVIF